MQLSPSHPSSDPSLLALFLPLATPVPASPPLDAAAAEAGATRSNCAGCFEAVFAACGSATEPSAPITHPVWAGAGTPVVLSEFRGTSGPMPVPDALIGAKAVAGRVSERAEEPEGTPAEWEPCANNRGATAPVVGSEGKDPISGVKRSRSRREDSHVGATIETKVDPMGAGVVAAQPAGTSFTASVDQEDILREESADVVTPRAIGGTQVNVARVSYGEESRGRALGATGAGATSSAGATPRPIWGDDDVRNVPGATPLAESPVSVPTWPRNACAISRWAGLNPEATNRDGSLSVGDAAADDGGLPDAGAAARMVGQGSDVEFAREAALPRPAASASVSSLPAMAVSGPPRDRENFADGREPASDEAADKFLAPDKSFVSTADKRLTTRGKNLGIGSANSVAGMSFSSSPTHRLHPAFEYALAGGVAPESEGAASALLATAPGAARTAQHAVETVLQVIDANTARDAQHVKLQFSIGESELVVHVSREADEVHATFRTDSAELRAVLAHEWNSAMHGADRGVRLAPAVFASADALAGEPFSGGSSSRQDQRDARRSDFNPATIASLSRAPAPVDASASAPDSASSSRSSAAGTGATQRLHLFA